jgi:hypothetical protein
MIRKIRGDPFDKRAPLNTLSGGNAWSNGCQELSDLTLCSFPLSIQITHPVPVVAFAGTQI